MSEQPAPPAPWRDLIDRTAKALSAGDAETARATASEACDLAPDEPIAHYAHGEALLALGTPSAAAQAFAAALRLRPRWAEAWVNLGIARYRLGAIEHAKAAMRQALAAAPGHAAASGNLGAFMRITGESEGADTLLRQTIERDPANVGARLNLAADLMLEERAEETLQLLDDAHAPAAATDLPARRHWLLQKSLALLQLRRVREARAVLAEFLALGPVPAQLEPLWHWRHVVLAQVERRLAAAGQAAERMQVALDQMGPDAVAEHRLMGHFDLAKFWSGQREHEMAFAHWRAGHALLKLSQPFGRDAHRAFIDVSIEAFPATRFSEGPRAFNDDPTPVFIVGMPRSGTTLCEQIIAAHSAAYGAGERTALAHAFERLGGGNGPAAVRRIADLDAGALDAAAAGYLAELQALAPGASRIVDKMPGNYLYLGLVGLLLPGARIIHCVRDPRDIGFSIFTYRFYGLHAYAHDLGDLGWSIAEQHRLMAHWKKALPNPILTLSLTDWVQDFDQTLSRVLDHIGLPHDPNCARFYEQESPVRTVSRGQVRQPVNARGIGRWRTYARELQPLIAELERAGMLADWPDPRSTG